MTDDISPNSTTTVIRTQKKAQGGRKGREGKGGEGTGPRTFLMGGKGRDGGGSLLPLTSFWGNV